METKALSTETFSRMEKLSLSGLAAEVQCLTSNCLPSRRPIRTDADSGTAQPSPVTRTACRRFRIRGKRPKSQVRFRESKATHNGPPNENPVTAWRIHPADGSGRKAAWAGRG